jgi:hypothetical protein
MMPKRKLILKLFANIDIIYLLTPMPYLTPEFFNPMKARLLLAVSFYSKQFPFSLTKSR